MNPRIIFEAVTRAYGRTVLHPAAAHRTCAWRWVMPPGHRYQERGGSQMNEGTFTTAATQPETTLTMEMLLKAARSVEEPCAKYMRELGFAPERGGVLVLPEALRAKFGGAYGVPSYVRFSALLEYPVVFLDPLHGFSAQLRRVQP